MTLFNTADPALRTGSVGEETAAQVMQWRYRTRASTSLS